MTGGTEVALACGSARSVGELAGLLRHLHRRQAHRRGGKLTYRQLAARTGWSVGVIGDYFSGKVLPPVDRFDTLVQLLGATPLEQGPLATARDRVEELRRSGGGMLPVPRQLPPDVPGFAGRHAQLAQLDGLGGASTPVVSALSGTAGVGKTALAVHWAWRVSDRFPDGQLYANLRGFDPGGTPMDPSTALRGFLDAFGVPAEGVPVDLDAQVALYRSLLAGRRVLLVLDNARDADQVRPLLPGVPGCLVVVTSRDQLTSLAAAEGAHLVTVDLLTDSEAGQLLVSRLGTDRVAAQHPAVDEIVELTGRLPLALVIVAARAALRPRFPLATFAAELRDSRQRLDALDAGESTVDIRAVFAWSYRTLTPAAARLFRLLGLHPGPDVSAAAVASLAGLPPDQVRPLLAELSRAHLAEERHPGRYVQHDLLRVYAADLVHRLDSPEERAAATGRLLDHYLHTAYTGGQVLNPHREPLVLVAPRPGVVLDPPAEHEAAMEWFLAEHPVLLAAVDRAAGAGFDTHVWQLAWTMRPFLDRRGHWDDLETVARAAVAAGRRLGDWRAQAVSRRLLADALIMLRRYPAARAELGRALALYRRAGDLDGQAYAHRTLSIAWGRESRNDRALYHARRALALFQAADNPLGAAFAFNGVGWFLTQVGEAEQGLAACQQALARLEELGNRIGQANTWDSLAQAYDRLGRHDQAVAAYWRAIGLFRELGHRFAEADSLAHLGDVHRSAGDVDAARDRWRQALAILEDLGHPEADRVLTRLTELDAATDR